MTSNPTSQRHPNPSPKPVIVGFAGGSGSGKSTFLEAVRSRLDPGLAVCLHLDDYYRAQDDKPLEERHRVNYDEPDALELSLFQQHLQTLKAGRNIQAAPCYDFTLHTRKAESRLVPSAPVILVDGILLYTREEIRNLIDLRLFVEAGADLRLLRRLARDVAPDGRGRQLTHVIEQYLQTVRPMHFRHVETSRNHAHLIIHNDLDLDRDGRLGLDIVVSGLVAVIQRMLGKGEKV